MKLSHIHPSRPAFLVLLLTGTLLVACDTEESPTPPPERITISGMVLDMPLATPLAGATIQLIANDYVLDDPNYLRPCECQGDLCLSQTTSDSEGRWAMEVPVKYNDKWAPYNMLIKVSKGPGPPQYNLFQPGGTNQNTDVPDLQGGTNQGDLQLLGPLFHFLFSLDARAGGANPNDLAVMFGVAIGFIDPRYPQEIALLPGVQVTAEAGEPPELFPITYLGETGLPDPDLTETSSMGVFYFTVPDANENAMPSVWVSGSKPGSVFVSSYFAACPGSTAGVAVIDPYFKP